MTPRLKDLGVELRPDPSRVLLRLFLPGEGMTPTRSRAGEIVRRIRSQSAESIDRAAVELVDAFDGRHDDLAEQLARHAETVALRTFVQPDPDPALNVVLGAAFTTEFSVEAAALCNPSAVRHPDQSGLKEGELRVAVSLRCIGEGHISSIGFVSAIIGGTPGWRFESRATPTVSGNVEEGSWTREGLGHALDDAGLLNEMSATVVGALPDQFRSSEVESAIAAVAPELLRRREAQGDLNSIRTMAWSTYEVDFSPETVLSQRVLVPVSSGESHGVEDARFVSFTDESGSTQYLATYTAYDGRSIAPRLLVSPDLRRFTTHLLTGPASANKGMALFPRTIDGAHWALTRTDGESISLAHSTDGRFWNPAGVLQCPRMLWEIVQIGNCGSPIETDRGWLVLTHGVGPMRRYAIGATLLDLADPRRVLAHLQKPLLEPDGILQEGYVPNVVYSCGGIVHDGTLWLPFGVGDQRVRAGSIPLDQLLDAMTPMEGSPA